MEKRCVAPAEISPGVLLAHLEGDASSQVGAHVDRCAFCQAELRALADVELRFEKALLRASCPSALDLLQFEAHLLDQGARRAVETHLASCGFCRQDLAQLAAVELPPARAATAGERLREAGRRLVSALPVVLSAPQPALRGTEQVSQPFEAAGYRLILAKVPPLVAENIWQLEGQLHAQQPGLILAGIRVLLLQGSQIVGEDTVDDLGFFALEQVAAGRYTLLLETPTAQIQITDFPIP